MFGEAMVSQVTGCKTPQPRRECVQLDNGNRPGIVSVIDIQNVHNEHVSLAVLVKSISSKGFGKVNFIVVIDSSPLHCVY